VDREESFYELPSDLPGGRKPDYMSTVLTSHGTGEQNPTTLLPFRGHRYGMTVPAPAAAPQPVSSLLPAPVDLLSTSQPIGLAQ
jgi:hypothetical protein